MPKSSCQRVVVAGAGIVSPLGLGWKENEAGLASNLPTFRPIDFFDVSSRIAKTAGIVDLPAERLYHRLSARREKQIDRGSKMLLLAIREALAQAGLEDMRSVDAVVIGTSAAAMFLGESYCRSACQSPKRLPRQLSQVEYYQSQRQMRNITQEFDWRGPVVLISNACASGANALGYAMEMIQSGRAQRVLAGGYDGLAELVFSGFDSLRALAPSGIPRPFDAKRDGLAIGEGAGMLLLESASSNSCRKMEALAELAGFSTATDLHHLTQPDPEGKAAIRTMASACEMAGIKPAGLDYINSHGTGTPFNDAAEAAAIATWAGEDVSRIAVSSTKSAMGHLLGGAGAVEAVICVMALCGQWLPGNLNIREVDPAVSFDLIREFRRTKLNTALTNSFGFGGTNASLLFTLEVGK